MQITKYGHSCLHVVDGDASILLDPGTFSSGFEDLTGLSAVLVTHAHPDHLDVDRLRTVLDRNPAAAVYADPGAADALDQADIAATGVAAGDLLEVGVEVRVVGHDHAVVHADLPGIGNVGYLVGGRLLHPGDALTVPTEPVEILALPVSAPWMALKESVDYLRAISPDIAVPIHDKVLASTGTSYTVLQKLRPDGVDWLDLDDGRTVER